MRRTVSFRSRTFELQHLLAAERQELARQAGGALAGSPDLLDRREVLGVGAQLGRQQLRVAENCGQQVVEVVGDAARELSDRIHLLSYAELLRHRIAFGDVAEEADDERLSADLDDRRRDFGGNRRAVRALDADLQELEDAAVLQRLSERGENVFPVLDPQRLEEGSADDLVPGSSDEDLRGPVHLLHDSVLVVHEDRVVRVLHEGSVSLFRGAERGGRLALFADLRREDLVALHGSRNVSDAAAVDPGPYGVSIPAVQLELQSGDMAELIQLGEQPQPIGRIRIDLDGWKLHQVSDGVSQHAGESRVDLQKLPFRRALADTDRGLIDEVAILPFRAPERLVGARQEVLRAFQLQVFLFELQDEVVAVFLEPIDLSHRGNAAKRLSRPHCFRERVENGADRRGAGNEAHAHAGFRCRGRRRAVDDDRDLPQLLAAAHFVGEAVAVHPGHQDVGDHGVDIRRPELFERLQAVAGLDRPVSFGFEGRPQALSIRRIVVDDQDPQVLPLLRANRGRPR